MQMHNYVNAMLRAALIALALILNAAPVSAGVSDAPPRDGVEGIDLIMKDGVIYKNTL